MEAYGYAIADATAAIKLNPQFVKVRFGVVGFETRASYIVTGVLPQGHCKHCDIEFQGGTEGLQIGCENRAEQQGRETQTCGV